jgi:small subunit ribosomal protein S21
MPTVKIKEGDTFEGAIRKFKRIIDKTRILQELRAREFHIKGSVLKQRQKAAAKKRWAKKLARERTNLRVVSRHNRSVSASVLGKSNLVAKKSPADQADNTNK